MAEGMKHAYGSFCSQHSEAMELYKDLTRSDTAFQDFIKRCSKYSACRRMSLPECFLLVAQRISKYPLLIEPIIKTTPDNTVEKKLLIQCLATSRDILSHVDKKVDEREKEKRLFAIYNKMDARSTASFGGKPFKKSDILSNSRKLIFEGHMNWVSARGKFVEVLAVVLSDVMFFLSETNHKSSFTSLDNKSGVVSLTNLLVRVKGDRKDSKGLYLIHKNPAEPEMYEFVCKTAEQRKQWIQTLKRAIEECPEEGTCSGSPVEVKIQEALEVKIKSLIERMHNKDEMIKQYMTSKEFLCTELLESIFKEDLSHLNKRCDVDGMSARRIFQLISNNVTALLGVFQSRHDLTNSTSEICHQLMELQQYVHQLMALYARQCTDFYRLLVEPDRKSSFRDLVYDTRYMLLRRDDDNDDSYEQQISSELQQTNDGFQNDFIFRSVEEIRKKKQDLNNQLAEVEQMKSDLERERLEFYSMKEKFISSNLSHQNCPSKSTPGVIGDETDINQSLNSPSMIKSCKKPEKFEQYPSSASYRPGRYKFPLDGLLRLGSEENFNISSRDSKCHLRAQAKSLVQSEGQKKFDVLHGSLNDNMLFVEPKVQISDLRKKFFNNDGIKISPRGRISLENNEMSSTQNWRATQSCSGSPGTLGGCSPQSLQGLMFLEFNHPDSEDISERYINSNRITVPDGSIRSPESFSIKDPDILMREDKISNFMHDVSSSDPDHRTVSCISNESVILARHEARFLQSENPAIYDNQSNVEDQDIMTRFHDSFDTAKCQITTLSNSKKIIKNELIEYSSTAQESIDPEKTSKINSSVAITCPETHHFSDSTSELSSKMNEIKMNLLSKERKSVINISLKKSDEPPNLRNKKKDFSFINKIQENKSNFHDKKERSENFSDSEMQEKRRPSSNSFCRVLAASIGSLASFYSTFSSSQKNRKIFKTASVKPPLTTTMSATDVLSSNRRCSSLFVSKSSKDRNRGFYQHSPVCQNSRHKRGTSNSSNDSISDNPCSVPISTDVKSKF